MKNIKVKKSFVKNPFHSRETNCVEDIKTPSITDQSGAMTKAQLFLALQRGASVANSHLDFGKHEQSSCFADSLDNALAESYASFEDSVLPNVEKKIAEAKKASEASKAEAKAEANSAGAEAPAPASEASDEKN
jgi:hypothetical protein